MKPPVPTERQVQRAILSMAGVCFPDVFIHHSPNGAHLAGDDVARFKQMGALIGDGMKKGFPDLVCFWNHGIALMETKRKGGKLSPDQIRVHALLTACGYPPRVVTCPEEAYAFLKERGAPCRAEWKVAA